MPKPGFAEYGLLEPALAQGRELGIDLATLQLRYAMRRDLP